MSHAVTVAGRAALLAAALALGSCGGRTETPAARPDSVAVADTALPRPVEGVTDVKRPDPGDTLRPGRQPGPPPVLARTDTTRPGPDPFEAARMRGVDFRAVGQEPGWYLELTEGGRLLLVLDYGTHWYVFTTPERERTSTAQRTEYRVREAGHQLVVTIERRPCADAMSGRPFEAAVRVVLDGSANEGCGMWLGRG